MRTRSQRVKAAPPKTAEARVPAPEEAAPDFAIEGLREGLALLGDGEDFGRLLRQSLDYAVYVMGLNPKRADPDFVKILTLKKEVMASVLSAGVRLNDAALRKKDDDKVGELLRQVKAKAKERGQVEDTKTELFS